MKRVVVVDHFTVLIDFMVPAFTEVPCCLIQPVCACHGKISLTYNADVTVYLGVVLNFSRSDVPM